MGEGDDSRMATEVQALLAKFIVWCESFQGLSALELPGLDH